MKYSEPGRRVTVQRGFGIGLYLAREIIHLHGGFLTAQSKKDRIRWNAMTALERDEQLTKGDFKKKQSEKFSLCGYLDIRAVDRKKESAVNAEI